MSEYETSLDGLPGMLRKVRNSDRLLIRGGGVLKGVDLTNLRMKELLFLPQESFGSLLRATAPRLFPLRVGVDIPVFEDCDFSGLCAYFDPWIARFWQCRFDDVQVRGQLIQAHFVDCHFSGRWEANFTSEAAPEDPARQVGFSGNDMRRLSGMDFFDVPLGSNRLDNGELHLVITRHHASAESVHSLLASLPQGRRALENLLGPRSTQEWILLEREEVDPETWTRLKDQIAGLP